MHLYDTNQLALFEDFSKKMLLRAKYRRIEAPYITDIKIVVSSHPNPNIPNGYEKIEQDINEAQLKILIKRHRIFKEEKKEEEKKDEKKDDKKKAKSDKKEEEKTEKVINFQEAIPGIKHQYTYILVKRSFSPENAICDLKLVLAPEGDPNCAELKSLINEKYRIIECPVQQYTGVRETFKKAVYLCFKNS